MNFLSHFYFDKQTKNSNIVLGTILPDLIKNANKDWNLHPQKKEEIFTGEDKLNSLLIGWKKHLEVDLIFHSSPFFIDQMAKLKQLLLPILSNSPVRPSFLSHIGVELVLDHLLVINRNININDFYDHLQAVDDDILNTFLKKCDINDTTPFFNFFNSFKSSRYLFSYQKLENISYALQRICMRLWAHPFDEPTLALLAQQLASYKLVLEQDYLNIYETIELKMNK